jgi:hypothetical protein
VIKKKGRQGMWHAWQIGAIHTKSRSIYMKVIKGVGDSDADGRLVLIWIVKRCDDVI